MAGFSGFADANTVRKSDIIDTLTSTATNKPLSAAQGKVLKGLLDVIAPAQTMTFDQLYDKISGASEGSTSVFFAGSTVGSTLIGTAGICFGIATRTSTRIDYVAMQSAGRIAVGTITIPGKAVTINYVYSQPIDALTSTDAARTLSAAQGKALNEKITTYKNGDVIYSDRVLFGYCASANIARFYHAAQKEIPNGATLTIAGSITSLHIADGTSITIPSGATLNVTRSNTHLYYVDIKGLSGLSTSKACYAILSNGNITVSIS